jgi:four helix bundle protein
MIKQKTKHYDLEERTLNHALCVRDLTKDVKNSIPNIEYIKQLIRASGSIGANYIETNESISKKDFILRIKIARKEA